MSDTKADRLTALLIAGLTLLIFLLSPVRHATDSMVSMLLSQSLLEHGSFRLDHYALPRHEPQWSAHFFHNGPYYTVEVWNGHLYYHFPPGSSVLSVPFVALLNLAGLSAANTDGTYNHDDEVKIEAILAAALMATLASIFFLSARLLLPGRWSVLVALGAALGTQVYSTASRVLWSHTWGMLLLGLVIFLLLRHEIQKRSLRPILLATLLAWMYFVRPTFAVHIFCISVYVAIFQRAILLRYALTSALWLGGFLFYSWSHFGHWFPSYYRAGRLQFDTFWVGLAGNLVSPSRGLLVYVPVILFVIYLLIRYRQRLVCRRLLWLSIAIIAGHLTVISGFHHWWGGHSFGPRFTSDLIPWFVLLGILGLHAKFDAEPERPRRLPGIEVAMGGVLLLLSIIIHTRGATAEATWRWNQPPDLAGRLWDWRQPQFLAGYLPMPRPIKFPPLATARIDFTNPDAEQYLWRGWSGAEREGRWSDGRVAAVAFALPSDEPATLRIKMAPFLANGKIREQRVAVFLNDQPLPALTLRAAGPQIYLLSGQHLRRENTLRFYLRDAASPSEMELGGDTRTLGISVEWIEVGPQVAPAKEAEAPR